MPLVVFILHLNILQGDSNGTIGAPPWISSPVNNLKVYAQGVCLVLS